MEVEFYQGNVLTRLNETSNNLSSATKALTDFHQKSSYRAFPKSS
ncbi:hypothetical protein MNBD_NITROSPINAE02-874 [hydrothermal vent metagenome]|uniref:Uncharacterized protein n=1 Tax=hydrothermal vent metagenome TaxID=652676 RepID=A0A3B1C4B9_9ZZZZ